MLELETIVPKSELPTIAERRGSLNDKVVTIDGTEYPPGTLVRRGFAGRLWMDDGLYHGCLRYEPASSDETVTLARTVVLPPMVVTEEPGWSDESEE